MSNLLSNITKLFWTETPVNAGKQQIVSLLQQNIDISRREINDWQIARESYYNTYMPTTVGLQECYKDSMLDLHLAAVMETRILNLVNKKYVLKNKDGIPDVNKTQLIRTPWFNQVTRWAAESLFYGYSLIHITETKPFTVKLIPRQHVIPQQTMIVPDPYNAIAGTSYNDYPDYLMLVQLGDTEIAGLLEKVFPLTVFKRHSWGSWDEFEQLFGIPIRIAKTVSADSEVKAKLEQWLDEMGRTARGVFPKGTELDIVQADKTDAFRVFQQKIILIDQQISKLILGQTGTTEEKAHVGAANIHAQTMQSIFNADLDNFLLWCNNKLKPSLNRHGFKFENHYIDVEYEQDIQQKIKIDQALMQGGHKLSRKYIERIYGVELEANEPSEPSEPTKPEVPSEPTKPEEPSEPTKKKSLNNNIETQLNQLYNIPLSLNNESGNIKITVFDAVMKDLYNYIAQNGTTETENNIPEYIEIAEPLIDETAQIFENAVNTAFEEELNNEPTKLLIQKLTSDVHLFSGFKSYTQLRQASKLLKDEKGQVKPFYKFSKDIQTINNKYNKAYLQTEYNNAIHSAQAAASWNRFAKNAHRYDLQYKAVLDNVTRDDHEALDRTTLPFEDPFWIRFFHPNGHNCRCKVKQVIKGKYKLSNSEEAIKKGEEATKGNNDIFRFNPGIKKQVFPEKHPYYKNNEKRKTLIEHAVNKRFVKNKETKKGNT